MRALADDHRIHRFMRDLGEAATAEAREGVDDGREMLRAGLVEREALLRYWEAIEPRLYRYPALDPASFRRAVEETVAFS